MSANHRIPTYQDDTYYYTWAHDTDTNGYCIACVPINGTYDDRALVTPEGLWTRQRAANYLHGMARRWKLKRVA